MWLWFNNRLLHREIPYKNFVKLLFLFQKRSDKRDEGTMHVHVSLFMFMFFLFKSSRLYSLTKHTYRLATQVKRYQHRFPCILCLLLQKMSESNICESLLKCIFGHSSSCLWVSVVRQASKFSRENPRSKVY